MQSLQVQRRGDLQALQGACSAIWARHCPDGKPQLFKLQRRAQNHQSPEMLVPDSLRVNECHVQGGSIFFTQASFLQDTPVRPLPFK